MKKIIKGSYGEVFFKDKYAFKKIKDLNTQAHFVHTLREIMIGTQVNHENIVAFKDVNCFFKEGKLTELEIKMDNEGITIQHFINLHKKCVFRKLIMVIMFQIFKGIAYLNASKIIHRDLHTMNVVIDKKTLIVKILDYGWCKKLFPGEDQTTLYYQRYCKAPEHIQRNRGTIISSAKPVESIETNLFSACSYETGTFTSNDYPTKKYGSVKNKIHTELDNPDKYLSRNNYDEKLDVFSIANIFYFISTGEYFYRKNKLLRKIFNHYRGFGNENEFEFEMLIQEYEKFEDIDKIPSNILCNKGKDLLKKCLRIKSEHRISATDALNHEFFCPYNKNVQEEVLNFKKIDFEIKNERTLKEEELTQLIMESIKHLNEKNKENLVDEKPINEQIIKEVDEENLMSPETPPKESSKEKTYEKDISTLSLK